MTITMKPNTLLTVKYLIFVFIISAFIVSCNQEDRQKPVKAKTIMFQPKEIIVVNSKVSNVEEIKGKDFPDLYNLKIRVADYGTSVEISCDDNTYYDWPYNNLGLVESSYSDNIYTRFYDGSIFRTYRTSTGRINLITEESYDEDGNLYMITFKPMK